MKELYLLLSQQTQVCKRSQAQQVLYNISACLQNGPETLSARLEVPDITINPDSPDDVKQQAELKPHGTCLVCHEVHLWSAHVTLPHRKARSGTGRLTNQLQSVQNAAVVFWSYTIAMRKVTTGMIRL